MMLAERELMAFVATSRADESLAFYRDVLGLRFVADEPFALVFDAQGIWSAPSGARIAWFKDPDGNVLSLAQF